MITSLLKLFGAGSLRIERRRCRSMPSLAKNHVQAKGMLIGVGHNNGWYKAAQGLDGEDTSATVAERA
jgi:hypothetical protein